MDKCSVAYSGNYSPRLIRQQDANSVLELFINKVNTDDYIGINSLQHKLTDIQ